MSLTRLLDAPTVDAMREAAKADRAAKWERVQLVAPDFAEVVKMFQREGMGPKIDSVTVHATGEVIA